MFIETEATPNPLAIKFYPSCEIMQKGSAEFTKADDYSISPLANSLFEIEGIDKLFFSSNFITVTKLEDANWEELRPQILGYIMEHFTSNNPVIDESFYNSDKFVQAQNSIEEKIIKILDERIKPALMRDGGDIEFKKYTNNTVYVALQGACAGCPAASITLKNGVERILCEEIPEIEAVEAITPLD